jgi:hypothetical protein
MPFAYLVGGYGLLVRRSRDLRGDAYWHDGYSDDFLPKGCKNRARAAKLITASMDLEHFVDPASETKKVFEIAPFVLCLAELRATPPYTASQWRYYGLADAQSTGFFIQRSLKLLANKLGKHFVSDGKAYHFRKNDPINEKLWLLLKNSTA